MSIGHFRLRFPYNRVGVLWQIGCAVVSFGLVVPLIGSYRVSNNQIGVKEVLKKGLDLY